MKKKLLHTCLEGMKTKIVIAMLLLFSFSKIAQAQNPVITVDSVFNVSCFGLSDGAAYTTASGGTAPYSFLWSNGNTTSDIINVPAGSYTITVTDNASNSSTQTVVITQPALLNVSISTTNISCFGANDGALCAVASGGTIPYTYLWSQGSVFSCINNLPIGAYSVTVWDNNGCSATNTASVTQPSPLTITPEPDQSICDSTVINYCPFVTGGVSPYAYTLQINGAPIAGYIPCITPINITATSTISLTVMDANGCITTDVFNVIVNPSPTLAFQVNVNSCNGVPAMLCVPQVLGGTPPYVYSWSNGNTTTCFSTLMTGTYSYTVTDVNGCTVTGSTTYSNSSGWTAKYLDNLTLPTCGNCDGAATAVVVNGNPVATYLWQPGSITTQTNNAICDAANSYVVITDTAGCIDTLFFSLSCHSVWPGDANYDGTANNVDLLSIGIGYGTTDVVRPNATINWQAEVGIDWADTLTSGLNYKHIDCNGDGIIADDDTIAIQQNYGQTHPLRLSSPTINPNDPYLYFDIVVDTAGTNQHVDVPLYFGTSAQPADSIYGLAFTVNYDTALVKADSIGITFSPSWIGAVGTEMITLSHNDALNGQFHVGMTRITHTDTSGYGEIARIGIVTTDNVSGKLVSLVFDTLTFFISDVTIINKDELLRGYNIGSDSLIIEDSTTSISEVLNMQDVGVYPNPARNEIKISGINFKVGDEINLSNVLGKEVYRNKISHSTSNIKLQTSNFRNGVYFITIKTISGNLVRKIMVLH